MQNWTTCFGFFVAVVLVGLKWTFVQPHPLGLEEKLGIHQRQPSYLPTYNGIFSIHALNYSSSSTADTPSPALHPVVANTSLSSERDGEDDPSLDLSRNSELQLFPGDGTDANELDFKDKVKISELTTFPQLQVMTQTIQETTPEDTTMEDTRPEDITSVGTTNTENAEKEEEETITKETTFEHAYTESETLIEGSGDTDDTTAADGDIFDRLMKTIQEHWLEFVGKMKLSVLDVWKSISHHMMERLENFASAV